ncbi:MAG: cytochrome c oxidase subunit 3 [Candidatus Binatus sp.]|uniref:cytochrome c oxidase subunit 3 n=1 Tax=Candidatus Binatus sp. TaxID=2811406 RepID=UPI00272871F9|nr:cytochrome c oxidase subunit 3 [Candidatus Binatus sp.]MDO8433362.1 cytochrome c oxidase subunit 3 [Candidatus Binatus sp.]
MSNAVHTSSVETLEGLDAFHPAVGKLGVWWFLASEVMIFGGLIGSYVLLRIAHGGWPDQASHVNWQLGAVNTAVLVTSSLTMILALNAVRSERRERAARFLLATVLLGFTFLGVKSIEYSREISEGFTPGAGMFWSFYYLMTGLHGVHVFGGIILNATLYAAAVSGSLWSSDRRERVEFAGLYWHFVDVVWIFLFPLLYLA